MNDSFRALTDEIMTLSEKYQEDCHQIVEVVMSQSPEVSVQDAANVFIFNKLAELQVQISRISEKINLSK